MNVHPNMTTLNFTNVTTEGQTTTFRPSYIIDPLLISLYLYNLSMLIKKYWHTLEPVHIFEINSVLDLTIIVALRAVNNIEKMIAPDSWVCILRHYVEIVSRWSLMADISMSQINMFLALYWNAEYKTRVTTRIAVVAEVASKIVAGVLAAIMVWVDPTEFHCHSTDGRRYVCTYFRRNNIFYKTIPMSVCIIIVSYTSIYVFKVVLKLQASVTPVVNIPISAAVNNSDHQTNDNNVANSGGDGDSFQQILSVKRLDSNPHLFYKVVSYHR